MRLSTSVLIVLLASSPALAQREGSDKNPCKGMMVFECYNHILAERRKEIETGQPEKQMSDEEKKKEEKAMSDRTRDRARRQIQEKLLDKASPSNDSGSASVITDLVSPFLLGFGFAGVSENDEGNTLNLRFNSLRWDPFTVSYNAEINDGEVFKPLLDSFPKKEQDAKKKELLKDVGDFDNTKFSIKFSIEKKLGRDRYFGRDVATYMDLYASFFEQAVRLQHSGYEPESRLTDISREDSGNHLDLIRGVADASVTIERKIDQSLVDASYSRIAELVNNQPQLIFGVDFLEREGAAGPDELSYEIRYEHGFKNVNSFLVNLDACSKEGKPQLDCLGEYLDKNSKAVLNAQRLSFALKYTDTDAFSFPLSDDESFTLDASRKWTGEASYGRVVRFDSNDKDQARFDLKAEYQDVEGDPKLQSRFVATATYTEKLPGNFTASLSAVWANKPEYRGEVDEEVSARFGLKWSVAKPKKDDKK